MLKRLLNQVHIEMDIIPVDPLLIRSGQATVGGVDMSFVRTYRFGEKEEPYIPGSSLKGVIRSYAEKICRSVKEYPVPVCLPYLKDEPDVGPERQASCGLRLTDIENISSDTTYRVSCPICRLFGSHKFIGRFAASDAYLKEEFKKGHSLEIRDGVAIDRFTGGAAQRAKYDLEVLTRGEFETTLEIRNFERWQLGLIGLVMRDMEEGLIRIGFGKSRGLGRIKAEIKSFQVSYFNRKVEKLTGIAGICSPEESNAYGFAPENNNGTKLPDPETRGLRSVYELKENWKELLKPAVKDFVQMIENVQWPEQIEQLVRGEG